MIVCVCMSESTYASVYVSECVHVRACMLTDGCSYTCVSACTFMSVRVHENFSSLVPVIEALCPCYGDDLARQLRRISSDCQFLQFSNGENLLTRAHLSK